jgi:hypothetical protein
MSLVASLCIYNQHDRSGSVASFFYFNFVDCHFSVVLGCAGVVLFGYVSAGFTCGTI